MKYTKQAFQARIVGELQGHLWSGQEGWMELSKSFPDETNSMVGTVQDLCRPGDFEDPKISKDSVIQVTLFKPNRRYIRYFDISLFKSLEPFLSEED